MNAMKLDVTDVIAAWWAVVHSKNLTRVYEKNPYHREYIGGSPEIQQKYQDWNTLARGMYHELRIKGEKVNVG